MADDAEPFSFVFIPADSTKPPTSETGRFVLGNGDVLPTLLAPRFDDNAVLDEDVVAREKDIFTAQAQDSGKPPEIIEKMIGGRIKKFLSENSLVEQPFVKDPDISVGKLVSAASAEVVAFSRFEVGEGIEVEKVDFADEVAAQLNG